MIRELGFFATAAALLIFGMVAVTHRNLFRAVIAFLGVLLSTAVLFLLLQAETVALVQVMVYIGGVMIFLLYGVLLTSELGGNMLHHSKSIRLSALAGCLILAALLLAGIWTSHFPQQDTAAPIADLKGIGLRLLDAGPEGFLFPFELVSVLLLAALLAAIAMARKDQEPKGGAT